MNHPEITNYIELKSRIMKLNYLREEQELAIKRNVKELAYSLHPVSLIKNLVGKITDGGQETGLDLKSIGLNIGKEFLMMKLFGKARGIKSFLSFMLMKKTTDYLVNHPDIITTGLTKIKNYISARKA